MGKDALNKRPLGVRTSPGDAEADSGIAIKDDTDTDNSSEVSNHKRVTKPPIPTRPIKKTKEKGIFRTSVTEKLKEWRCMYPKYLFLVLFSLSI